MKEELSSKYKRFWRKMRTLYRFTASNESSLEEEFTFRLVPMQIFLYAVFAVFFIILLTSFVLLFTPMKAYMPGFVDRRLRKEIVQNAVVLDSLSNIVTMQEEYINNIRQVMTGNISVDSLPSYDSLTIKVNLDSLQASQATKQYVRQFEEEEKFNLASKTTEIPTEGLFFYKPVQRGIVSVKFDIYAKHFGIDLLTHKQEPVQATLDGTVVLCCLGIDGYIIQVQHKNNFISLYRHTSELLKKEGDKVKAGEAIAIAGMYESEKPDSEAALVHFELCYKGKPLNPEEYIIF